jgi:hypothetical protein
MRPRIAVTANREPPLRFDFSIAAKADGCPAGIA